MPTPTHLAAAALLACLAASPAFAQQYFQSANGSLDFEKPVFSDDDDPANWDTITPNVAITRSFTMGI